MFRNIATVGVSDLEAHVIKATYPDHEIPKAKHIEAIWNTVCSDKYACRDVIAMIRKRIDKARQSKSHWQVLFKSLLVIHKYIQDRRDRTFVNTLASSPLQFLYLTTYLDRSSTTSWGNSVFCRQYASYIGEKLSNYRELGTKFDCSAQDAKKNLRNLSSEKLLIVYETLLKEIICLTECKPFEEPEGFHPLAKYSMILLAKDAYTVTTVVSLCVYSLMDHVTNLTRKNTERFLEATDSLIDALEQLASLRIKIKHLHRKKVTELLPGSEEQRKTKAWLQKVKGCLESHLDGSDDSMKIASTRTSSSAKKRTGRMKKGSRGRKSSTDSTDMVTKYNLNDFLDDDEADDGNSKSTFEQTTKKNQQDQEAKAKNEPQDEWVNFDEIFNDSKSGAKNTKKQASAATRATSSSSPTSFDPFANNKQQQPKQPQSTNNPTIGVLALFDQKEPTQTNSNPTPYTGNPFLQQQQQPQQQQGYGYGYGYGYPNQQQQYNAYAAQQQQQQQYNAAAYAQQQRQSQQRQQQQQPQQQQPQQQQQQQPNFLDDLF